MSRQFFVLFVSVVLVQFSASNPIPVSTNNQGSLFETKNTHAPSNITGHNVSIPPNYLIPLFGFSHYQFGIHKGSVNANFIGVVQNVTRDGLLQNNCDIFNVHLVKLVTDMHVTRAGECQQIDVNGFKYVWQQSEVQLSNSIYIDIPKKQ
ncbi:unnamed protein product [Adineta ricciae]|uniref:Uncharacterized protein n=1 Tax=Adineta ricciae TaxID=249248 RepID=A0A814HBC0_ADIRI|nr:unnamed protein product [Adineta ricciae]